MFYITAAVSLQTDAATVGGNQKTEQVREQMDLEKVFETFSLYISHNFVPHISSEKWGFAGLFCTNIHHEESRQKWEKKRKNDRGRDCLQWCQSCCDRLIIQIMDLLIQVYVIFD